VHALQFADSMSAGEKAEIDVLFVKMLSETGMSASTMHRPAFTVGVATGSPWTIRYLEPEKYR